LVSWSIVKAAAIELLNMPLGDPAITCRSCLLNLKVFSAYYTQTYLQLCPYRRGAF
jgi:hypothetical protein